MNLLLVAGKMGNGGAETHIFDLMMGLKERGHKVTLVSSGGRIADRLEKNGVDCITITLHRRSVFSLIKAYLSLVRIIHGEKFDVVHSHTRLSSFLLNGICRKKGVPLVTTAHAKFSMGRIFDGFSYWGDATIAVGEDIKQHLILHSNLSSDNVPVILNGIDTEKFSPRKKEEKKRICFLSRLDTDCSSVAFSLCRIAPLLTKKYKDLTIEIGGDGEQIEAIRKAAREINDRLGREAVRATGRVEDVSEFLGGAAVFVGVSRSALEAMSCGVPTVFAGDEGFLGLAEGETLDVARLSNYCCRGAENSDDGRLFEALSRVLSMDNAQLENLSKQSREYVICHHSFRRMAELTEQVYRSVAVQNESGRRILLCGYYGFGNIGDDALLRSAVKRARKEYPNCHITALTKKGDKDRRLFGVRCVKRTNAFSVAKEIKKADAVIFGGGTLLQNDTSRRSLMYYLKILCYAQRKCIDTLLWGNGIGRIDGEYFRRRTAITLSKCDHVGLRDDGSVEAAKKLLEQYSLQSKAIHRENDLAVNTTPCDADRLAYIFSQLGILADDRILVVAAKGSDGMMYRKMLEKYVSTACKSGLIPVYIPMYPEEDIEASLQMLRLLGGRLAYPVGVADVRGIVGRAEMVVAMRFHTLVFARDANVPFVAFGSQPKLDSFRHSCGDY